MTSLRSTMKDALKSVVVPYLKLLGFKGSMPNFYRAKADHWKTVSIGKDWPGFR